MKRIEKVVKDKEGKLSIKPKFYNRGCYFYWIPEKFLGKIIEGDIYFFKFGIPRCYGKRDKKGRPIYMCAAIPVIDKETGVKKEIQLCSAVNHRIQVSCIEFSTVEEMKKYYKDHIEPK